MIRQTTVLVSTRIARVPVLFKSLRLDTTFFFTFEFGCVLRCLLQNTPDTDLSCIIFVRHGLQCNKLFLLTPLLRKSCEPWLRWLITMNNTTNSFLVQARLAPSCKFARSCTAFLCLVDTMTPARKRNADLSNAGKTL